MATTERSKTAPRGAVWYCAVMGLALLGVLSAPAGAQESQKTWRISDPGQAEVYNTQQEAADAIKDLVAPSPYDGAYEYVDTIKETRVSESGDVAVTYWMGLQQPSDPDWAYRAPSSFQPHTTEAEAVAAQLQFLNRLNSACPTGATLTPSGDWVPQIPDDPYYAEKAQIRHYATTIVVGDNTQDSPCRSVDFGETLFQRLRRFGCPKPYTDWSDDHQACANDEITATITSKTEECEVSESGSEASGGLVGNPCNVKTGDKYQPEPDLDLPWISFSRHYHSVIASQSGGFGPGWTHSLDTRLSLSGGSVGLIDGSGYQARFHKNGEQYFASDNSGDRVVASGGVWLLYRSDSVLVFDSQGRLLERQLENGAKLLYTYLHGRLDRVTHSTGRSLEIQYEDSADRARITAITSAGTALATYTYSPNGQVETVTYAGGGKRTYHYEDSRFPTHLTGVTAEDTQRYSTFAYDEKGRAVSSQHADGADGVTMVYTASGGAVVTDALGHETTYGLTTGGSTRKVDVTTDSRGSISQTYYENDLRQRLDTVTDRKGARTKHSYSESFDTQAGEQASIHSVTEAQGTSDERTSEVRRAVASNRIISSKAGTREVRYARNARLQPTTVTVTDTVTGASRTQTTTYCEQADVDAGTCPQVGLVKEVNGPRTDVNDTITYTYYPSDDASCASAPSTCPHRKGDLWMVMDAVGNVTENLKYDGAGRALSVKDANGVITDFEYHPRGWLSARKARGTNASSEADDQITRIDYYPTGLVKKTTLPGGSYISYTYNAAHRLTDITDGEGNKVHYTLDKAGNRTKEDTSGHTGGVLRTLSRVYNQLGQLQTNKDAYEHATGYTFDANGNTDTVTDALSRVSENDYDPLNRLTKTIQDVGGLNVTTQFKYDALDNLTEVIDPKNLSTKYNYNGFGELKQLESPDTGITGYTYDSAGNRRTQTDARDITATYGYDALNRPTSISYPDSTLNVSFSYDTAATVCATGETFSAGRLSRMTDGSGSTQYCYDRFGQLVRKVQSTAGKNFTVRYAYTKAGQLSALTYPDGTVADYVRDAHGRTTEVGVTRPGKSREVLLTAASYYPFGPVAEWVFGNGRVFKRSRNQNYQPGFIEDTSAGGLSLGYEFNAVGNLAKLRKGDQSEPPLRRYVYDTLSRLTETRNGSTDALLESYSYDATGNRLSTTDNGVTAAHTVASSSHRLMSMGGASRSYDTNGNTVTTGATKEFVYNNANRMSAVRQGGVTAMSYVYNGKGEQVRRSNGGIDIVTAYDEAGHWLGEYDATGAALQQVIWLNDLPIGLVTQIAGGDSEEYPGDPGDPGPGDPIDPPPSPESFHATTSSTSGPAAQLYYVEADALGTPRTVIDGQRNVAVWKWELTGEAFGNDVPNEDTDGDGHALVFNLRFPGQRYDAASGLNYNYFRDYEPASGRYIQSDPIGLNGGISTYGYVGGNPVHGVDPSGLEVEPYSSDEVPEWLYRVMIGTQAHAFFTSYVTGLGQTYGSNNTYSQTFGNLRPDAYNTFTKQIWELKPISNRDREDLYRGVAVPQMARYLAAANRSTSPRPQTCGAWNAGYGSDLQFTDGQIIGNASVGPNVYAIRLYHDTHPGRTGLIFYQAEYLRNNVQDALRDLGKELSKPPVRWWVPGPGNSRRPRYP